MTRSAVARTSSALSDADHAAILGLHALLKKEIGLDAASLGERVLLACYRSAMQALQLSSLVALRAACDLPASVQPSALKTLIEHVVVPESWFFRVREQFDDLVQAARLHFSQHQRMRILSLPCANGEEAYSIVMCLTDAGFAAEAIDVVGIDLSAHSIDRAKRAIYRNSALRGQARHAQMQVINADEFQISAPIQSRVQFRCANFIELDANELGQFDAVFVRNLLIYLTNDARAALLNLIASVSHQQAPVFAGHAELLPTLSEKFKPWPAARSSLSFVRADSTVTNPPTSHLSHAAPSKRDKSPRTQVHSTKASVSAIEADKASSPQPSVAPTLDDLVNKISALRRALDQGDMAAAQSLLAALLKQAPTHPEVHYCHGLAALAQQQLDHADQAFKRCLYLARDHQEALTQRLLIAKRTASAEAPVLQARLQRLRLAAIADGGKSDD
jgi:chemotaxis protein methyltransferase WspC